MRSARRKSTSAPTGGVAEGAGEERLPDADGSEEDHVLVALEEAEAEEVLPRDPGRR